MGEGTQRPAGERRRRREAARAAELAAERAGAAQPPTRRELRRREAEEAARLEAIATGELRIGDVQATAGRSVIGESQSSSAAASIPMSPTTTEGASGASAASAAPSVSSSSAVTAASGATAGTRRSPSRRSLRERTPETIGPERPTERTATGRRPVVRTPTTAQGIRLLDATGQLTGVQPVVRPDEPSLASPADAAAVGSDRVTIDLDGPARTARDALRAATAPPPARTSGRAPSVADSPAASSLAPDQIEPTVKSPGVPSAPQPQPEERHTQPSADSGDFPLRPRWVAVGSISGQSADDAQAPPQSRRSVRGQSAPEPATSQAEQAPPASRNPALTVVKVAVLVAVAVILGALIWLLGSEALSDDSATDPRPPTIVVATYFEETSAR